MTDQTRWGIDMVQQENKAKAHAEQKSMRDELAFFVMNCTHFINFLTLLRIYS